MAGGFNFTANLNVQLNAGSLRGVQTQLNAGLKGLTVPINVTVSPTAQASLNKLNTSVNALAVSLRNLQAEANRTNSALNTMATGLGRFNTSAAAVATANARVATSARQAATAAKLGGDQFEYFGHQMRLSGQRLLAFSASAGVLLGVTRLFREVASEAYNFERVMVTISQVSTESAAEVAGLGKAVGDVAVKYGVSSKQLISVAEQLKQTGLSIKDVQSALEPLAKASLGPSFGDIQKTTQGAIAATRQFGIEIKDLEGALGSINAVAAGFAVESGDIIEAVKRAGGAFKAAGGDLHEFNALFTAVRATTRQSAETISTGLRTIFTRLQRSDTIENLKELGIQLQYTRKEAQQLGNLKLENQFVGPMEAIRRISQEVKSLSATDPRFSNIAEQIGGYRQIAQVIPLLQQTRLAQDAYNTSLTGNISLTTAAEKSEGALFRQLGRVNEQFQQLGRNILADQGFRSFISASLKLASALATIMDNLRPLIPLLATFAAVKIGQNLGSLASGLFQGPKVNRFHSGGYVSGSGERPAFVEGGEYVLRRQAVSAIGKSNLDRVNYAAGGEVKYAKTNVGRGNQVGLYSLGAGTAAPAANVVVPLSEVGLRSRDYRIIGGSGLPINEQRKYIEAAKTDYDAKVASGQVPAIAPAFLNRYGSVNEKTKRAAYVEQYLQNTVNLRGKAHKPNADYDGVVVPVTSYPIGAAGRQQALGVIDSNIQASMTQAANELVRVFPIRGGPPKISGSNMKSVIDNAFTSQGKGRFFEGVVQLVRGANLTANNTAFDISPPIPPAIRTMFSGSPAGIYADLKLNDTPDARKSLALKAVRQFGLSRQNPQAGGPQGQVNTADLESLLADPNRRLEISESGQNYLNRLSGPAGGSYKFDKNLQSRINPLFTKKAEGGPVNVLAMPGEVVVPPEDVKKIGIHKLRRMNTEGRYADGGVVGGSGSQDNVPLSLREGSFVLRKRAVEKLGLFNRGGYVHMAGGDILSQTQKDLGFIKQDYLNDKELEALVQRNIQKVIAAVTKEAYGPKLKEEAQGIAVKQAFNTGRLFNPEKIKRLNPVTRQKFTREDLNSSDPKVLAAIDKAFVNHLIRPSRTDLSRAYDSSLKGGISDIGKGDQVSRVGGDNDLALAGIASNAGPIELTPQVSSNPEVRKAYQQIEAQKATDRRLNTPGTVALAEEYAATQDPNRPAPKVGRSILARTGRGGSGRPPTVPPGVGAPAPPPPPRRDPPPGFNASGIRRTQIEAAPAGGTQSLTFAQLPGAASAAGVDPAAFAELTRNVRLAAASSKRTAELFDGTNKVLVDFQGGVAKFKGFEGERAAFREAPEGRQGGPKPTNTQRRAAKREAEALLSQTYGLAPGERPADPGSLSVGTGSPRFLSYNMAETRDTYNLKAEEEKRKNVKPDIPFLAEPVVKPVPKPKPIDPYDLKPRFPADTVNIDPVTGQAYSTVIKERRSRRRTATEPDTNDIYGFSDDESNKVANYEQRRRERRRGKTTAPYLVQREPVEAVPLGEKYAQELDFHRRGIASNRSYSEVVQERAIKNVRELGGDRKVSQQTKNQIILDQQAALDREFIAVTTRQLQVIRKGITAKEAENIATEQLQKAKLQNTQILRGSRGEVLGLERNIDSLPAGTRSDARGRYSGYLADKVGGIGRTIGGIGSSISGINRRATEAIGGQGALTTSLFVAGGGLSYLAGGIDSAAGTADNAVLGGREGRYAGSKGLSGALTGAASGAALGSIFGVFGAIAGGVAGAGAGLVSALIDAGKEIREVKIANAVTAFGDKIGRLANQTPQDRSALDVTGSIAEIRKVETQVKAKSMYEATGYVTGFDSTAYENIQKKETRAAFGGQVANINQVLEREIEVAVRRNRGGGDPRAIAGQVSTGGNGLNQELLRITAAVRNVPLRQVMDDLVKSVVQAQRVARAELDVRTGQIAEGRNLAAFGRLANAAETAALSIEKMDIQSKLIGETFSGQLGATRVTAQTNLLGDIGSTNQRGFAEALGGVSSGLGAGGRRLFEAGTAANQVGNLLPSILAQVASSNPLQQEDFTGATRRQLYSQLGFADGKGAPEQVSRAVETVVGQLRGLKIEDLLKESQTDVTKLTERVLNPLVGPLKEAGVRAGKALETEANRFVEGLTELAKRQQEIGGGRDRIATLQLATTRQRVGFAQQAGFRRNEGVNDISLAQLNAPFDLRQQRLTGLAGAAASDPNAIAARLAQVRAQLGPAAQRQQEEFQRSGGTGPRFEQAASELVRLRDQATRLQQALGHLADASERNVGAQEKLASIGRDRESRASFGERLINASAEEKVQIQRGLVLANQANNAGSIRQFSEEDQRLIINTLGSLGQAKLTGFRGQPNAADVKERLVGDYLGAGRIDPDNAKAEKSLQEQVLQNMQQAIEAEQAGIVHREALQTSFFQNLQQSHQIFLTELRSTLAQGQLADKRTELGQVGENLRQAREKGGQAGVLRAAGIRSDTQADTLRSTEGQTLLNAYRTRQLETQAVRKRFADTALETPGVDSLTSQVRSGYIKPNLGAFLTDRKISGAEDQQAIVSQFRATALPRLKAEGINSSIANLDFQTRSGTAEGQKIATILQEEFGKAVRGQGHIAAGRVENTTVEARNALNQRVGGGFQIEKAGDLDAFSKALEALKGQSFDQLNTQIQNSTAQFERLSAAVSAMEANLRGGGAVAPAFASGGMVPGRPRGTDTVPAWLTPNEYIVNAASAKANAALLHEINKAKGPIYRAGGGFASFLDPLGLLGTTEELETRHTLQPTPPARSGFWDIAISGVQRGLNNLPTAPAAPAVDPSSPPPGDVNSPEYQFFTRTGRRGTPREIQQFMMDGGVPAAPATAPAPGSLPIPPGMSPLEAWKIRAAGGDPFKAAAPAAAPVAPAPVVAPAAGPAPIGKAEAEAEARKQALTAPGGASGQYLLSQIIQTRQAAERAKYEKRGIDDKQRAFLKARQEAQSVGALQGSYYGGQAASLRQRQRLSQIGEYGLPGQDAQQGIAGSSIQGKADATRNVRNSDWFTQEQLRKARERAAGVQRLAEGGWVKGGFGGTDDVAANLTRGEFVLSRPAVQSLGVAAVERMHYLAKGGSVQYLANGGFAGGAPSSAGGAGPDLAGFMRSADALSTAFAAFNQSSQSLSNGFNTFSGRAEALSQALTNFPGTLKVEGQQTINVIHNGVEAFSQMNDAIAQMIDQKTEAAIKDLLKSKFPDA